MKMSKGKIGQNNNASQIQAFPFTHVPFQLGYVVAHFIEVVKSRKKVFKRALTMVSEFNGQDLERYTTPSSGNKTLRNALEYKLMAGKT